MFSGCRRFRARRVPGRGSVFRCVVLYIGSPPPQPPNTPPPFDFHGVGFFVFKCACVRIRRRRIQRAVSSVFIGPLTESSSAQSRCPGSIYAESPSVPALGGSLFTILLLLGSVVRVRILVFVLREVGVVEEAGDLEVGDQRALAGAGLPDRLDPEVLVSAPFGLDQRLERVGGWFASLHVLSVEGALSPPASSLRSSRILRP